MNVSKGVLVVDPKQKHFLAGKQTEASLKGQSHGQSQIAPEVGWCHFVISKSWVPVDFSYQAWY
jgi:hypothetical protein